MQISFYTLEDGRLISDGSEIQEDICGQGEVSQVDHRLYREYVKDYVKHYRFMYVLMMIGIYFVSCIWTDDSWYYSSFKGSRNADVDRTIRK